MSEQPSQPADRRASTDTLAILLATVIAPLASSLMVNVISHAVSGEVAAIERMVAHPAMAEVISFFAAIWRDSKLITLHGCLIAWLGVVPAMMLLRAVRRLRVWTALPAGAVLPLSSVSAVALLMWGATSATTTEKFVVYGVLVAMTVPAAIAAAVAFWGVYAFARREEERVLSELGEPRST